MHLVHKIFNKTLNRTIFFSLLSVFIFLLSYNYSLFWDNVLFGSKQGNQLFDNNIFDWTMPDSFDPGHPPFLGFILAIGWKIFGHKLWVAHLMMIPFNIGLFFQLYKFASFYIEKKEYIFFGFILIFLDPTLLTQLFIINPEILLLFFFFLSINSILTDNYKLKIIGLFFLSIVSYRSMMLAFGVFIFDFFNQLLLQKRKIKKIISTKFIISYLIGSLPGISFIIWRLLTKGWLQTHPGSPWEDLWHIVSFKGFLRNIIIYIHRYIDFGRVFIFIFILFSLYKFKHKFFTKKTKQLLLLALSSVLMVSITSIVSTNTMGHRYYISAYIIIILLAFIKITDFIYPKFIYTILVIGLITGNFWIYPRTISQGWDASLAHIPYYDLRKKAILYLDNENISLKKIATFFPNTSILDEIDVNGDTRTFENYNGNNDYIFYSNVYNLSDEGYNNIDKNYTIIKVFNKNRIHIHILKRKK